MHPLIIDAVLGRFFFMALIGLFFFSVTRGALLLRALSLNLTGEKSHVYPIYSDMSLIKLVDFQPIISAILLFQYRLLVSKITGELKQLASQKTTSLPAGAVMKRFR